jgi:P-type Mg2+ transporter
MPAERRRNPHAPGAARIAFRPECKPLMTAGPEPRASLFLRLQGKRNAAQQSRLDPKLSAELIELSRQSAEEVIHSLATSLDGLTASEAARRLAAAGANLITQKRQQSIAQELMGRSVNPLNVLLLVLALVSYLVGDQPAALLIAAMVVLSISLGFIQGHRSNTAAAKLRAMVRTTASVRRKLESSEQPATSDGLGIEIALEQLVPRDIVCLSAGDHDSCGYTLDCGKRFVH